jgi:hypothetical protein
LRLHHLGRLSQPTRALKDLWRFIRTIDRRRRAALPGLAWRPATSFGFICAG